MTSRAVFAGFIFISVLTIRQGIIIHPCEVADVMYGKMGATKSDAANWVCLAKFASGFNTQAVSQTHEDRSEDFGIFQINDKYCRKGTKFSCGVNCTDLVSDNIMQSAKCALWIHSKKGFCHWSFWIDNCRGRNMRRHVERCSLYDPFNTRLV